MKMFATGASISDSNQWNGIGAYDEELLLATEGRPLALDLCLLYS